MNKRLKEVRLSLGMKQAEFADKIGVTNTAICKLESGERNLTDQMVISICRTYNVNEDWLRYGIGDMFVESDDDMIERIAREYDLGDHGVSILRIGLRLLQTVGEDRLRDIIDKEIPALLESAPDPDDDDDDVIMQQRMEHIADVRKRARAMMQDQKLG